MRDTWYWAEGQTLLVTSKNYKLAKYAHNVSLLVCKAVVLQKSLHSSMSLLSSCTSVQSQSSLFSSQKLWSTQQAEITVLMLLMLQSHLFLRHCHLSLRRPNALFTVTRALLRLLLKVSCAELVCWFSGNGVISHGRSGYAPSPSIATGTLSPPNLSVICGNSIPLWPLSYKDELPKTVASLSLPGQPTLMSQNRRRWSTTPCRMTE